MAQPAIDEQAERRRIMAEERRMRTYHGHALDAEPDPGGRYSKVHSTTVVGSSPIHYPAQAKNSPWRRDECPPEPPLGFSVDDQPVVGEPHEVRACSPPSVISPEGGGEVGDGPALDCTSEARPVTTPTFKRRF